MTPEALLQFLTSTGFGILSAIVPIINAEAYVIASQVSALADPVPVAVGVGIGQSIGKLLLFLGVRRGKDFPFIRSHRVQVRQRAVGSARRRFRDLMDRLLQLVGTKRWGLPITFVAAVVGLPPLFAVALLAGATRMRAGWFFSAVLVGRIIRFVAVALGLGSIW